ncbi:hypothetical protein K2Z84_08675, partial [Candidatus Binatia bacterium]|nr:hypothetical protein [Candidatus Binatia bacterium]
MSHRQAMLRGARVLLAGWMLAACTPVPSGPHVMVYPGRGKSLYAFDADDANCRAWAASRVDESPQQAATDATVGGAAIGTLLGGAA